jgi:GTPase
MVTLSHDPEAGTLYWYFAEIAEGGVQLEGECDATLLLDAEGMIIGATLELDESVRREDLALALAQPGVSYDGAGFLLTIRLFDEAAAEEQPLDDPAILDFDGDERLLGFEVQPAATFGLATRLERLKGRLVAPELVDEPQPDRSEAVIGEWLARQGLGEATDEEVEPGEAAASEHEEDRDKNQDAPQHAAGAGAPLAPPPAADAREPGALAELEDDADAAQASYQAAPPLAKPQGHAADFRSGFVAIVGKPNVGKSTLLNALLGQKVAITSPKPQTTRVPMRGMLNLPGAQLIFIDTPGIHAPRSRLGSMMVDMAKRAIPDADVVCFMVDITEPPSRLDREIAALVLRARAPHILLLNKTDATTPQAAANLALYRELGEWDMELALSARKAEGLDALVDELVKRLPLGPPLYPEDQVSDQSVRELASELVREKVLRFTEQEVPHAVAVELEEWEQREGALYMRMTVYAERESQKAILIGSGGAMLKKIGTAARADIERQVGQPVYLDLWVKTRPNWRDDPQALRWLGYTGRDK